MEAILGKQSGESITGEVLQRSGSDILLSMGNNQLLQAKLEGNMSALPGQLLTFQIKNNGGGKVVLSPLFENMSQDPNISKALRQAGLPETGTTMQMVKSMMEEGLPIDKQSLYQMNRLISLNPQADITTLVQMQRLSLFDSQRSNLSNSQTPFEVLHCQFGTLRDNIYSKAFQHFQG